MHSRPLALLLLLCPAIAYAAEGLNCPAGTKAAHGSAGPGLIADWCTGPDLLGTERKNGPYRRRRSDGSIAREGSYVDGKRHGHWSELDAAGQTVADAEYRFGELLNASGPARAELTSVGTAKLSLAQVKADPQRPTPTQAVPHPAPAVAPMLANQDPGSPDRSSGDDLMVEASRNGQGPSVVGTVGIENTLSSVGGSALYAPSFDLALQIGSLVVEGQWGLAMWSTPVGLQTTPLNPSMFLLGRFSPFAELEVTAGAGGSIPLLSFGQDSSALLKLSTAMAVPTVRGMRDFWQAMPEVPVLIVPIHATAHLERFELGFETTAFTAIPIHGGSSDLGLQLGAGLSWTVDILRVGGHSTLVLPALSNGQAVFSLEPQLGVRLGSTELTASFLATLAKPAALAAIDGLLWSANLGVNFRFD